MSDRETIPGTVFTPRQVRMLKILVIVLSILLVLGFALLLGGLIYQASKLGGEAEQGASRDTTASSQGDGRDVSLAVPAGARVERIALDGGHVLIHLRGQDGEQVIVVDTARGNAVTRLRLTPE